MKKKKNLWIIYLVAIICLIIPSPVFAEQVTYGEILDELAAAQRELDKNNQSIGNSQNQINKDSAAIKNLESEIQQMSDEAVKIQQEIADSNVEIAEKSEQSKEVISYLQMSQGENVYLEYVFGGESITDLVYRLSIVEQITEYNEKTIKDLENLINKNEARKVDLSKKEKEHQEKIVALNNEIKKLNSSVNNLQGLTPDLKQQVDSQQKLVAYYRSQGCKNRGDVIGIDCARNNVNARFSRPYPKGYVTSFIGIRGGALHRGIDLGSPTGRGTPLYSIGDGTVIDKYTDTYGALCLIIQYRTVDGNYYALYAHMSRYNNSIQVGSKVNANTVVGYMGDTGKAYGVHLHLEVWPCRPSMKEWDKYTSCVKGYYNNGFKGAESVINFPGRTYQTWYTK